MKTYIVILSYHQITLRQHGDDRLTDNQKGATIRLRYFPVNIFFNFPLVTGGFLIFSHPLPFLKGCYVYP